MNKGSRSRCIHTRGKMPSNMSFIFENLSSVWHSLLLEVIIQKVLKTTKNTGFILRKKMKESNARKRKEHACMNAALYSTHSSSLGFFGSMLKEMVLALRWRRWLMEENERRESEVLQDNCEWPCRFMKNKEIFSFL
jgi:hypothetical protein